MDASWNDTQTNKFARTTAPATHLNNLETLLDIGLFQHILKHENKLQHVDHLQRIQTFNNTNIQDTCNTMHMFSNYATS